MEQRNTVPSWLGVWYAERPLLLCLLAVNLLWALYVLLAVSVLPVPLAAPLRNGTGACSRRRDFNSRYLILLAMAVAAPA